MFGLAHDSMQGAMRDGCDEVYRRHTRYVDPSLKYNFVSSGKSKSGRFQIANLS